MKKRTQVNPEGLLAEAIDHLSRILPFGANMLCGVNENVEGDVVGLVLYFRGEIAVGLGRTTAEVLQDVAGVKMLYRED